LVKNGDLKSWYLKEGAPESVKEEFDKFVKEYLPSQENKDKPI
jgi:hypothetical protein